VEFASPIFNLVRRQLVTGMLAAIEEYPDRGLIIDLAALKRRSHWQVIEETMFL